MQVQAAASLGEGSSAVVSLRDCVGWVGVSWACLGDPWALSVNA